MWAGNHRKTAALLCLSLKTSVYDTNRFKEPAKEAFIGCLKLLTENCNCPDYSGNYYNTCRSCDHYNYDIINIRTYLGFASRLEFILLCHISVLSSPSPKELMEFPAFMYELHGSRCLMCGSEGLIYMNARVVNNKFLSTAALDALKVRGGSYYMYMYMYMCKFHRGN